MKNWEITTIEKVKQVAEQTRQQIVQTLSLKRSNVVTQFDKFSQELVQLNNDLNQLAGQTAVELNIEQSNRIVWDRMI